MRIILSLLSILTLIILISGCAPGGTSTVPGGLPVATSDETYTTTLEGVKCKLVDATSIGGTLNLADNCVISGTAPHADNKRIIPFKVEITDDKDVSKVHEMHLTVEPRPISFEIPNEITPGTAGSSYTYSFASNENPKYGNPPYTFTVSGQPMGLIMNVNGVLSGDIPEGATIKPYTLQVCVKDLSGNQACDETVLTVSDKAPVNVKIDSVSCRMKTIVTEYGDSQIREIPCLGTASGPVGTMFGIGMMHSERELNCGSWTRFYNFDDHSNGCSSNKGCPGECIRGESDPETTTWSYIGRGGIVPNWCAIWVDASAEESSKKAGVYWYTDNAERDYKAINTC